MGEKTYYQILQIVEGFFAFNRNIYSPSEYTVNSILSVLPQEILQIPGLKRDEISKHWFFWTKRKATLRVLEKLPAIDEGILKQAAKDAYTKIVKTLIDDADESYLTQISIVSSASSHKDYIY